jgi:prepilin-type N-terminal cleavage/methylation domain-containing protein
MSTYSSTKTISTRLDAFVTKCWCTQMTKQKANKPMIYSVYMRQESASTGFTLVELLVVITIIGVLSSTVLAGMSSARERSRDAARISQLREVQKALEIYYVRNGSYPNWSLSVPGSPDANTPVQIHVFQTVTKMTVCLSGQPLSIHWSPMVPSQNYPQIPLIEG